MNLKNAKTSIVTPKTALVQIRMKLKDGEDINPYEAYSELQKAFEGHPKIVIEKAEFRMEKEDEKTSIL